MHSLWQLLKSSKRPSRAWSWTPLRTEPTASSSPSRCSVWRTRQTAPAKQVRTLPKHFMRPRSSSTSSTSSRTLTLTSSKNSAMLHGERPKYGKPSERVVRPRLPRPAQRPRTPTPCQMPPPLGPTDPVPTCQMHHNQCHHWLGPAPPAATSPCPRPSTTQDSGCGIPRSLARALLRRGRWARCWGRTRKACPATRWPCGTGARLVHCQGLLADL